MIRSFGCSASIYNPFSLNYVFFHPHEVRTHDDVLIFRVASSTIRSNLCFISQIACFDIEITRVLIVHLFFVSLLYGEKEEKKQTIERDAKHEHHKQYTRKM